jgi:hypothetical protein
MARLAMLLAVAQRRRLWMDSDCFWRYFLMFFLVLSLVFSPKVTLRYFSLRRRMRELEKEWRSPTFKRAEYLATSCELDRVRRMISMGLLVWAESKEEYLQAEWLATSSALQRARKKVEIGLLAR